MLWEGCGDLPRPFSSSSSAQFVALLEPFTQHIDERDTVLARS
jgi:hypothetical protein